VVSRPVSIVTVSYDTFFFTRLLVEKVREFVGDRAYELIAVDRGSRDGTREWLEAQRDVRLIVAKPSRRGHHGHGEAAELGAAEARFDHVVLLDSDAHPVGPKWLELTVDRLDSHHRLSGGVFHGNHKANPHGWYIHPHFMAFPKADLGGNVILRKTRGLDLDTGEAATVRLLDNGFEVIGYPIEFCRRFDVGHPHFPTETAGVFHAWYGTRLGKDRQTVGEETSGAVTDRSYLEPLQTRLRQFYQLDY
jgi:glycosyltransferase involved in cell wall biosynthesis